MQTHRRLVKCDNFWQKKIENNKKFAKQICLNCNRLLNKNADIITICSYQERDFDSLWFKLCTTPLRDSVTRFLTIFSIWAPCEQAKTVLRTFFVFATTFDVEQYLSYKKKIILENMFLTTFHYLHMSARTRNFTKISNVILSHWLQWAPKKLQLWEMYGWNIDFRMCIAIKFL